MYEDFWGLKQPPFDNLPNANVFFPSSIHEEGLVRLFYTVKRNRGAMLLTGEVGAGKTTLVKSMMSRLSEESYQTALIENPLLSANAILSEILIQLGGELPKRNNKFEILKALRTKLNENIENGKGSIVIIDEAQLIRQKQVIEELRLLLNLQTEKGFLLTLILVGQPELLDAINQFTQLEQRIALRYHLTQMNEEESDNYISFRLEKAGQERKLFSPEALTAIYNYSQGIPRKINKICDLSLLLGWGMNLSQIEADLIDKIIRDREV